MARLSSTRHDETDARPNLLEETPFRNDVRPERPLSGTWLAKVSTKALQGRNQRPRKLRQMPTECGRVPLEGEMGDVETTTRVD